MNNPTPAEQAAEARNQRFRKFAELLTSPTRDADVDHKAQQAAVVALEEVKVFFANIGLIAKALEDLAYFAAEIDSTLRNRA